MFGTNFRRQRAGGRIRTASINAPQARVEGLSRARYSGPGVTQTVVGGIPLVRVRKPSTTSGVTFGFFVTAGITAASYSAGQATSFGTGTGHQVGDTPGSTSVSGTSTTIINKYPDAVTATSGKYKIVAAVYDGSTWWLLPPSCSEISAT